MNISYCNKAYVKVTQEELGDMLEAKGFSRSMIADGVDTAEMTKEKIEKILADKRRKIGKPFLRKTLKALKAEHFKSGEVIFQLVKY